MGNQSSCYLLKESIKEAFGIKDLEEVIHEYDIHININAAHKLNACYKSFTNNIDFENPPLLLKFIIMVSWTLQ